MLKDITKIMMSGAIFDSLTPFEFFNPHDGDKIKTVKSALIYGRNGSGKSTIAKAFRSISGKAIPEIKSADVYDDDNQIIELTEEEKKHIYVFDESYVDTKVKLQEDHLDTIVMLGDAADLTDKIQEAEDECAIAKASYEHQDSIYMEYTDNANVKSPDYYKIS